MTIRTLNHVGSITTGFALFALVSLYGAAQAAGGGKAITVGSNACSNGHGVSALDCMYFTQGGKVTVCHFDDHDGDYAVASPAACGNDD